MNKSDNQIIIFKTENDKISINVRFDEETVWLTLDQMAELFDRDKSTVSRHINNVFDDGELDPSVTIANFAMVQTEGARRVERQIDYYNLDVIISVGYRVKSLRGTQNYWKDFLDKQLSMLNRDILTGSGSVSHKQAVQKAEKEFEIYRAREKKQLESDFDRAVKALVKKPKDGDGE